MGSIGAVSSYDGNTIVVGDPGNDFIREVKPHKRQNDFLSIPDSIFEALFGGAAYGGKSFILTLLPLIRGFYKYRGFKGIILRRTFPDLEREVIRLSKEYYPLTGAKYNEQKHTWEWPEYGSYLDFGHIQHLDDVKRQYDTAQYNYCAFDELTHFEEAMYIYMVGSRIRPGSSFNIAIVRNGTNPGGIGQKFVYERFVKPAENGYKIIRDSQTTLKRIFIPSFYTDNPYGMEYDPDYGNKLEILPEAEKRAKKYGDWHAFKGSVFTTFRPLRFPGEPDNALHVIEPFKIPEWWPRFLAIDWGKRAMCYALWGAISPDKRVYAYRERAWFGKDIPIWASEVREIWNENNESYFVTMLCGSAWQRRGSETIADQFQEYSGLPPTSTQNTPGTRVATLQIVHDLLRWEHKPALKAQGEFYDFEKAQEIFRNYGEEALRKYRAAFLDEDLEKNIPILQIFKKVDDFNDYGCPILIDTIPIAVYDDDKVEDVAEFDGDDPIDDLRYFCKAAKGFINNDIPGIEQQRLAQEARQKLEESKDMTAYYRHMEQIEKKVTIVTPNQPVAFSRRSRFARRRRVH